MARFLSPAWFAQVSRDADPSGAPADVVLQQVVTDAPEGLIRYQVSFRDGRATIHPGSPDEPTMTFTSDYTTASAIACGSLSTEAALSEGRLRVSGNLSRIAEHAGALDGLDPMQSARAETAFENTDPDAVGGHPPGGHRDGMGDA